MGPDCYNTRFPRKRFTFCTFCIPETEATAVVNLRDIVLNLPQLVVSRGGRRIFTNTLVLTFQATIFIKADVSELECKRFCRLRRTVEKCFTGDAWFKTR